MKKIMLTTLCAGFFWPALAQNYISPEVKDPNKIIHDLFEAKDYTLNHHFTMALGQGEYLLFEMEKLSIWNGKDEFMKHIQAAIPVLARYQDSLLQPMSTKCLDIHIPVQNTPLISRFRQQMLNSNLQAMTAKETVALKMTYDTLRIVKKFADRKFQGEMLERHFQYTFLFKDLRQAKERLADKIWLDHTAFIIDSVVMAYRQRWHNQDAWNHHLFVSFDTNRGPKKRLQVTKQVSELNGVKTQDMLMVNGGLGVGLVRNTICPVTDIGLQVNFYSDYETTFFTRASMSSFTRFEEQANTQFKPYTTLFVNAELGFGTNENNTKLKPYTLSLGVGYKLLNKKQEERDISLSRQMYRLFISYQLSKNIVVTPEWYTNLRSGVNVNSWSGLSVIIRLF